MLLDSIANQGSRSGHFGFRLAGMAAAAYSLLIVYASLQPLSGWQWHDGHFGSFVSAPWPLWITTEDVLFNVLAYLPLGFLVTLSLLPRRHAAWAVTAGILLCALLSFLMESVQQYLPTRIASNVDLLVNTLGAAVGALVAPLFSPGHQFATLLTGLRGRWLIEGRQADAALLIASLWLITHATAHAVALGTGDLRVWLPVDIAFAFSPSAFLIGEGAVAALNLAGIALLLGSVISNGGAPFWRLLALLLACALLIKAGSYAWLLRDTDPWTWITPGLMAGFAFAMLLTAVFMHLRHRWRAALALLFLCTAVILVNRMPENPYRQPAAQTATQRGGHVRSFSGMVRALSDLWPFLAIATLLASLPGRYPGRRREL
jgi:VanZ family protein